MADANTDFGIDLENTAPAEVPAKRSKKEAIDPELDRDNWPVIHIEMEEDKPNYEYLAAHGTLKNGQPFGHELQVMRGVDVAVPPSIVNMLRTSVAAHYRHVPDPKNPKKMQLVRSDRSAVPWRLVKGGKYIQ